MRAFVSYTLRDGHITRDVLSCLMRELEAHCEPFIDLLWHPRGGHQSTLFSALRHSDVLLLALSPSVLRSPWVCLELESARRLRIPVIAIPTPPPQTRTNKARLDNRWGCSVGHVFRSFNPPTVSTLTAAPAVPALNRSAN